MRHHTTAKHIKTGDSFTDPTSRVLVALEVIEEEAANGNSLGVTVYVDVQDEPVFYHNDDDVVITSSNFPDTHEVLPNLTLEAWIGRSEMGINQGSETVAMIFNENGQLLVETPQVSRYVGNIKEAKFFTAAVIAGEWEQVSDGAVMAPIS